MRRLKNDTSCTYNADPSKLIDCFAYKFRWLSNFHPSTLIYNGLKYPTVEHAYQANKTLVPELSEMIRNTDTPAKAKRMGKVAPLRPDWDEIKIALMRDLVHLKFENPLLQGMLLETGDAQLAECNSWHDTFWGLCRGEGKNWLGVILMDERAKIRGEV